MTENIILKEFQSTICKEIELFQEGSNRYKVFVPFSFEDGDEYCIVLQKKGTIWQLTDEGHTLMHLSYDMDVNDIFKGTRGNIIDNALVNYEIDNNNGELNKNIKDDDFGNALFSFIQGLIKITDIEYLSRERARSTFMDDFRIYIQQIIPPDRLKLDYFDNEHDPKGMYTMDFCINGMEKPVFLFGIPNNDKTKDVTVNILQYERWGLKFRPVAVFEAQEEINRKVLARFSDVVDRQFSNLVSNKERIESYFKEVISIE
ncbi:MAG: DUF1828 domain-containing protein [Bacteroidales bacterium]|nr:DUF1828 domain-containing protein [Bacteroidales bacterium]